MSGIKLADINIDGNLIGSVFSGIGNLAKDLRIAITGKVTEEQRIEIESKLLALESQALQAQREINLEEAKHKSIFVSGWRPSIGWVCSLGLAIHFIFNPLFLWVGILLEKKWVSPVMDFDQLLAIIIPLLGLGAYRTLEKIKKVN